MKQMEINFSKEEKQFSETIKKENTCHKEILNDAQVLEEQIFNFMYSKLSLNDKKFVAFVKAQKNKLINNSINK